MAMNNELMLPLESNDGGIVTPDACFIFQLCSLANFALSLGSQGYKVAVLTLLVFSFKLSFAGDR